MKITDEDLILIAASLAPYGQVDDAAMASELLQRRAEVRRLRKALREVSSHSSDWSAVDRIASKALAPKRKRRAK